jgi:16S rRNA G527 N7-methylase RsmG
MLADGARMAGIPLDAAQLECFRLYLDELLLWNRRYNLVATQTRKKSSSGTSSTPCADPPAAPP